jgi:hypothetical protein
MVDDSSTKRVTEKSARHPPSIHDDGKSTSRRLLKSPRVRLIEIWPQGIVDDDCPTVGEGFDPMADTSRYDRDQPRSGDLRNAVDVHLKLTLNHFVDFFLRVEMFVNGRVRATAPTASDATTAAVPRTSGRCKVSFATPTPG